MAIDISPPLAAQNRGKKLAIVVGGGPAPGINGVIRAATIAAINAGLEVYGILEGFKWLAQGDTTHVRRLTIPEVSRIHLQGGSVIGTSRENPSKSDEKLTNVIRALRALEIDYLITIGGDDTASTATRIDSLTGKEIEIAHVPKTIDNDLPLPDNLPTFGYETARQVGVDLVCNLMEDARTTMRWYIVVAMGRTAGHLALGMGKASGATVTIIPEEFRGRTIRLAEVSRILEGAFFKRKLLGESHGVAIIAEGTAECIDQEDLAQIKDVERDEHGHVRLAELPFGRIISVLMRSELAKLGHKVTTVDKNIGYELRSANPVAVDLEYTQDLGSAAVRSVLNGKSGLLICVKNSELVPLRLQEMLDPATGKMRVRRVNVDASAYDLARRYMIRLGPTDFEGDKLNALAGAAGLSVDQFQERYGQLARPW